MQDWEPTKISVEPKKTIISLKVSGRAFSHISPGRKYFTVYTYNPEEEWKGFPIHQKDHLESIRFLLKTNVERLK